MFTAYFILLIMVDFFSYITVYLFVGFVVRIFFWCSIFLPLEVISVIVKSKIYIMCENPIVDEVTLVAKVLELWGKLNVKVTGVLYLSFTNFISIGYSIKRSHMNVSVYELSTMSVLRKEQPSLVGDIVLPLSEGNDPLSSVTISVGYHYSYQKLFGVNQFCFSYASKVLE